MSKPAQSLKILSAAAALALSGAAGATTIAFDLVGSASQNLISHTNVWAGGFSSSADGFEIYQRGVSATIPFAVLDDSLVTFPPDEQGIIDDNNLGRFFGVADTVNGNTSGPVSASWDFDISGFADLSLALDVGAMGDFESSDSFSWMYSIDGGAATTLFEGLADEAISQDYTLAGGFMTTLNDPMAVGGILLSNQLQTFSGALLGTGSVLTVTLTANTNGGDEAFAFQNLIIEGRVAVPEPASLVLFGVGLIAFGLARRRKI